MEVQINNIADSKLKKEYKIIVPHDLIDSKVNEYIEKVRGNFNLKGFRKGQVPASVVKEKYGKSILAEESDKLINDTIKKIVNDNDLKLALSPKVDVKEFKEGINLEVSTTFELYPEIPDIDLKKLKITKREPIINQSDIDESFDKILQFYRKWEPKADGEKSKKGDSVDIDYVGKIDDKEFEGGAAKGHRLELGSKSFIDNFEDQLIGKRKGDEVKVKVKFPKEYHKAELAGKPAIFEVKINDILSASMPEVDDKFIKDNFGLDSKEKLEEEVKKQVEGSYKDVKINLFKKELFDFLNKKYPFELPEGLVEEQVNILWAEVEEELKTNPDKFKNEKEQEKAKKKKRELAERMIRSGMILSDIANKQKIDVNNDDINQELQKILARFPGQDKQVIEYYQKNPNAASQLRGAIIENKTIDYLINLDEIDSKKTSLKDLDKLYKKANEQE
ncbi:MAG: trigger factor [Rickettsiales bacterium]|nr:trigger factor [Rickettsiales bacterium]